MVIIAPVDEYIFYKNKYPALRHLPLKWLHRMGKGLLKDIFFTLELYFHFKKERPDIILNYTVKPNIYGAIAGFFSHTPTISMITGLGYTFIHNGVIPKLVKKLYKLTAKLNKYHIFENQDDRELFINTGFISTERASSIKGCGVDVQYFKPNQSNLPNNSDKIIFSFIGRLVYDKGLEEFVQAASIVKKLYPPAQFLIAGKTDSENPTCINENDLIDWTKDGDLIYKGFYNDIREIIRMSDAIVLPSYREGMPCSLTEGMAMGKPLITTNTAGCRETVEHGKNGLIVPIKNSRALAEAMHHFVQMPKEERTKMGVAGRQKALEEFDSRKIANQIYGIVQKVIHISFAK